MTVLAGNLLRPGDEEYARLCSGWNTRVLHRPEYPVAAQILSTCKMLSGLRPSADCRSGCSQPGTAAWQPRLRACSSIRRGLAACA
jgi:hypothetical protein